MPTKFGNNHGMQHLSMMQEGKSAGIIDPNKSGFQAQLSPKLWRCKNGAKQGVSTMQPAARLQGRLLAGSAHDIQAAQLPLNEEFLVKATWLAAGTIDHVDM